MQLHRRHLLWGLAATAVAAPAILRAQAPDAPPASPRIAKIDVGRWAVTCIEDAMFRLPLDAFPGADPAVVGPLLEAAGLPAAGPLPAPVTLWLIERDGQRWLVDCGVGQRAQGPGGGLVRAWEQLGFGPEAINAIAFTHLHGDHCGGLIDAEGKPVFPNARIIVPARERDTWLSPAPADAPDALKRGIERATAALAPYRARMEMLEDAPFPAGMTPEAANGHTPGHTHILLEDEGERLLITGDTIASAVLQFANPDQVFRNDFDPAAAAATRRATLERAVRENLRLAGTHWAFPGLGFAERDATGFRFRAG